jgi:hypothetical protein
LCFGKIGTRPFFRLDFLLKRLRSLLDKHKQPSLIRFEAVDPQPVRPKKHRNAKSDAEQQEQPALVEVRCDN